MAEPTNDFDLDKSRWFNTMKIGLACKHAKTDAAIICERLPILSRFPFDPVILTELKQAETALSEALLGVKVVIAEYERMTAPEQMQAAE